MSEKTLIKEKIEVKHPPLFAVIMHNDDYTTMDFVVDVLERFFHKERPEAMSIMLEVHERGRARVAVYTREVAESKADKVGQYAKKHGHPLKCTFEPCET